jgi:hypothetical protein
MFTCDTGIILYRVGQLKNEHNKPLTFHIDVITM